MSDVQGGLRHFGRYDVRVPADLGPPRGTYFLNEVLIEEREASAAIDDETFRLEWGRYRAALEDGFRARYNKSGTFRARDLDLSQDAYGALVYGDGKIACHVGALGRFDGRLVELKAEALIEEHEPTIERVRAVVRSYRSLRGDQLAAPREPGWFYTTYGAVLPTGQDPASEERVNLFFADAGKKSTLSFTVNSKIEPEPDSPGVLSRLITAIADLRVKADVLRKGDVTAGGVEGAEMVVREPSGKLSAVWIHMPKSAPGPEIHLELESTVWSEAVFLERWTTLSRSLVYHRP